MKVIALDDDPLALEVVRALAAKVPFLELRACFTDAFAALTELQRDPVDLLLLDINMPDLSGLELVRSLPTRPLVIFTTAYAEHAVAGFELDAVDFLLKPFSLARFAKACAKAHELLQLRDRPARPLHDHTFLKIGAEQVKVSFAEILYLEAAGNYVTFVLPDQRLLARLTFGEVLALLPAGQFARVHRSYIVAKDKIDVIERHQVRIRGRYVPVAAAYLHELPQV